MKHYKNKMYNTIIFDLDDTLTDDKENIKVAFKKVLEYLNEDYTDEKFDKFYEIDKKTWKDKAEGKLITPFEDDNEKKREWLRASRFLKYFNNEITYKEAVKINDIFLEGMKEKVVAREGVFETLEYLYQNGYNLVIATNGPLIPLNVKLEKLKIKLFINIVFSAEEVGFCKPQKLFYKALFKKANLSNNEKILFVGDDLIKDIKGGIENGLDTCWCNYKNEINDKYNTTYEIHKISDLMNIL